MPPLQSKLLNQVRNLKHGYSHRKLSPLEKQELAASIYFPKQVHKDTILWLAQPTTEMNEADAVATTAVGITIGVQSADCVPILIAAVNEKYSAIAIMAIHAGWRGTQAQITAKGIQSLYTHLLPLNKKIDQFLASIGPCISQSAYEVGPEVAQYFSQDSLRAIQKDNETKFLLNLAHENKKQMEQSAMALSIPTQIEIYPTCTYGNADYFPSFRRDGPNQDRILSFLSMYSEQ